MKLFPLETAVADFRKATARCAQGQRESTIEDCCQIGNQVTDSFTDGLYIPDRSHPSPILDSLECGQWETLLMQQKPVTVRRPLALR